MALLSCVGSAPVAVDTVIFIYLIQEHPKYVSSLLPLFEEADNGARSLITSAVTLLETLVLPYRRGDVELAARYEKILTDSRGVTLVDLCQRQLGTAAQLRAATGIKVPDALQLAAAVTMGCLAFLTNDRALPEVAGVRIIQLDSVLGTAP